ncbi:MAG TPA: ABC transporter permease [Bacillota bacterium]|jgi:simple sugar transport system permease protein
MSALLIALGIWAQSSMRLATPILLTALGENVAEKSGIINVGIEGEMLVGAFVAFATTYATGSLLVGLISGASAGLLVAAIFALAAITLRADQVVVGTAINLLGLGLTGFLYRSLFVTTSNAQLVSPFPSVPIPGLSRIPVLGPMLFHQNVLVYMSLLTCVALWVLLARTSLGNVIIATGEHPRAADTLGINVLRVRWVSTLFGGVMAGLAGAFLSIGYVNTFVEGMTSGRGFIALAVVILGRWNPLGILAGSLIFGGASALQVRIQILGNNIPTNLVLMLPYVLTILSVIVVSKKRSGSPAALGIPYRKS